jgi:hypothetical protein
MKCALAVVVLIGCSSAPPPRPAADFHPAPLWSLRAGGQFKWVRLEGSDSGSLIFVAHTKQAYGRIALWSWDPAWPNDPAAFAAGLVKADYFHNGMRFAITTKMISDGEWLFRGKQLPAGTGQAVPAFVMVRTVDGARFVCMSVSTEDEDDDIHTELEGCRSMRVKAG